MLTCCTGPCQHVNMSITTLIQYIATDLSVADEGPSLIPRRQLRTYISHIHLSLEDLPLPYPMLS
jgi:hypothetical protein